MALSKVKGNMITGTLAAVDGSALTNIIYDIGFTGGFDASMVKEDLAVSTYGETIMTRAGTFVGESGYIDTAGTGAIVIIDVEKNGATIYSTKPQFAISANTLSSGTLSVTTFAEGDRITFKVTQIGSSAAGQGIRFGIKTKL